MQQHQSHLLKKNENIIYSTWMKQKHEPIIWHQYHIAIIRASFFGLNR